MRTTLGLSPGGLSLGGLSLAIGLAAVTVEARGGDAPHWAFLALSRPAVPAVAGRDRVRTPLDAFILERLERQGLTLSPDASRSALVRRLSLDLLGLPPTPAQTREFLEDDRPDAYERLVDRLLSSPHFGERHGRHWLDASGYVDVYGGDNDAGTVKLGEGKWRYRDWVVRRVNEDQAFDRFLLEQLAGDELIDWREAERFTPEIIDLLTATGFLRAAADDTNENELNTPDIRHGVLQRTSEVVAGNVLALTLNCAKCHDHKYDPISQREYYALAAIFSPAFDPERWLQPKDRQLPAIGRAKRAEIERHNGEIDTRVKELEAEKTKAADAKDSGRVAEIDAEIGTLSSRRRGWEVLQAVYDVGPPTSLRLLERGDWQKPAEVVEPGVLAALSVRGATSLDGARDELARVGRTSGRRLALARWLTAPHTPAGGLVARVLVNRIWQRLLGEGIVATTDNFGAQGTPPSHPELLEWLASELVDGGWSVKSVVRLIVTSSVYRQTSEEISGQLARAASVDPGNTLLWRQRLRRLESEAVRDSILAVAGTLDRALGGEPVPVDMRPDGSGVVRGDQPAHRKWRRSIYLLSRRNYHLSLLGVFDQPRLTTNCTRREASAVVTQSLTMLNDPLVIEQAGHLARRVATESPGEAEARVDTAFRLVFGRPPTPEERDECVDFLERQEPGKALEHLCHALLNTSEFLYRP